MIAISMFVQASSTADVMLVWKRYVLVQIIMLDILSLNDVATSVPVASEYSVFVAAVQEVVVVVVVVVDKLKLTVVVFEVKFVASLTEADKA